VNRRLDRDNPILVGDYIYKLLGMFIILLYLINSAMKRTFSLLLLISLFSTLHAQYKVQFIVKEKTAIHRDSIYITGTFNNWDSGGNLTYLMQPHGENEKSIVLNLNEGIIGYKFTRGNWFRVEKHYNGDEVADRVININKDTVLTDSVESWRDLLLIDKKFALTRQKSDTARVVILAAIANFYTFWQEYYNSDSAVHYAQMAVRMQQKIIASNEYTLWKQKEYSYRLIDLQENLAILLHTLGNFQKALEIRLENLKLAEKERDKFIRVIAIRNMISDYTSMKDYHNGLTYGRLDDSILSTLDVNDPRYKDELWNAKYCIANCYYKIQQLDSALFYAKQMDAIDPKSIWSGALVLGNLLLGDIDAAIGDNVLAFHYYRQVIAHGSEFDSEHLIAAAQAGMAKLFQNEGQPDSALFYAKQSYHYFRNNRLNIWQAWGEIGISYVAEISSLIADIYKGNNRLDSAYKYLDLSVTLKDSLYNADKIRQFQTLTFNETTRRQQLEQQSREAKQLYENKVKMYSLLTGLVAILAVAFILYRNNKQKQKANTLLQVQKQEIENTLGELKITQKQLIHSEKMASLGELTAGIAHEIQNPLNFVNNFSEVCHELIDEMVEEIDKGHNEEVKAIANDVKQNLEKIGHHGKRADAIVKGMLLHSRSSSGIKEPANINAIADEYLRLAYHGLRAKDKSFNATMITDLDKSIGNINVIPQDIGRVILNLIMNAFYAVTEKKKVQPEGFEPTVWVSTRKINGKVEVRVKDNGNGIPQNIFDKVFQPFFTTKPTGQGTGLGLSLSYDIITKGHQGELKVETKESEGTEFIIVLPV
jgi:two-component system, NtrC family, sensor kinase